MTSIIIVDKTGNISSSKIKENDLEDLYKKAGLKSCKDFKEQTFWTVEVKNKKYGVHLYGKTEGRAGQENKYDFPPPVDNTLFFGKCVLIMKDPKNHLVDLNESSWKSIYEYLFGGFEDIGDEDSEEEEEEDELENVPTTKEGYAKDGFIVDDDDDEDDEDDEDEEEDEEEDEDSASEEYVAPKKTIKTRSTKSKAPPQNVFIMMEEEEEEEDELECTSELSEESYE